MEDSEEKKAQEALEKQEENQTSRKLSLRDLLEVQGGLDSDDFMRDCTSAQCYVGSVVCVSSML